MIPILGFLAGTLTTLAFVPQVIRTWRTGSANDLSLGMLLVFNLGVGLWLVYGLALGAAPIVAANAVTLPLSGSLLVLKLAGGRAASKRPPAVGKRPQPE
jgi:MtN3 and saliva related transmembrane protein